MTVKVEFDNSVLLQFMRLFSVISSSSFIFPPAATALTRSLYDETVFTSVSAFSEASAIFTATFPTFVRAVTSDESSPLR